MLGAGVPVHVVASIHGHDPVITQRSYAHTQTADAVAAMSALDKILRPLVDAWAFLRPHRGRCGLAGSAGTGRSRSEGVVRGSGQSERPEEGGWARQNWRTA